MTTAPTLQTFYHIARQAVIDMDYLPGVQINTFALVDGMPDLEGQSFGYGYSDFEHGYFWSRGWVLGGGDPNTIKGEFPVLFLELNGTDLDNGDHEISLTLVDKIECESCPPELVRTGPTLTANLTRAARALLSEVNSYVLYDMGSTLQWMSEGRAETVERGFEQDELSEYLDLTRVRIRPWGDYPGLRGITLNLTLTTCESGAAPFRYDTPVDPLVGAINCGC